MRLEIPAFDTARVLVVGDVMLDRYWHGNTSRISPEAPVPVVHVGEVEERPGGAGNVGLNIASLGAAATVMGVTGADEPARVLEQRLQAAGIECGFHRLGHCPTVTKLRVISRHQQLIRLDFEDGFGGYDASALLHRAQRALADADVVVLSDYSKGTLRPLVQDLIGSARAAGKPVLVDPKGAEFGLYRGATVLTPNLREFEAVVGSCANEDDIVEKGGALMQDLDLQALLITRSEHGVTLLQAGQPVLHLPTRAREVFDVTGAGDTVISVLAAALAAGMDLAGSTALANLAAGIVVGKLGTAAVTVPELYRALQVEQESGNGVLTESQLLEAVDVGRAHGETIVMTNGCFDILHAGHVTYLEQARRLGDRLIVAVNDDDSVRRLKGEGRPVNAHERRMTVLAALGCYVADISTTRLIEAIRQSEGE
jgi:D-beta-D-heptose 7-phosphate kinase/D-beta-D-heptose 1-phosphate adenosyltransferase